jgi:hypothetical protein
MSPLVLTAHAITRYQERVDPGASPMEARLALGRLVALGHARSTPRHWMRADVQPGPGVRFIYWSSRPGVCAVAREGVVVTVLTRSLCRGVTSRSHHLRSVPMSSADLRVVETQRWRWDGRIGEAA